jgi:hypothetical protein
MPPNPANSHEESWDYVLSKIEQYPETPYWVQWQSIVRPLISGCVHAGYSPLFRAGMSMHDIIFSTVQRYGLKPNELRVTMSITEEWAIKFRFGQGLKGIGVHEDVKIAPPEEAFVTLTRFLQQLWMESVSEPLPEILRSKPVN